MKDYIVAIPSRFASTRFPGKPLVMVGGIPMVKRVCMQALKSDAKKVVACIDDERVQGVLEGIDKVEVCMTSKDCNCGTDRLAQMIEKLNISPETVIVNVQGDEPLIDPEHIEQVAALLESTNADMATLCFKIDNLKDVFDPNCVKVVFDKDNKALYFSRAPIPYERDNFKAEVVEDLEFLHYHHVGIYAYKAKTVLEYSKMPQTMLEKAESLEQLRLMENGKTIAVGVCANPPQTGVDTQEDLDRVNAYLASH
ncbi:MAG: 3-deoxy-manno-octulosonate cytidylyltransferase [Aeromonadales bacterium]|nr:3-deoxy-manno-octulosonate cytidylyltransferase [Aeromonadales bacterium]